MEEPCSVSRQNSTVTVSDLCTAADSDDGSEVFEELRPCTRPVSGSSSRWLPACTPKLRSGSLKRALTPRFPKRITIRGGAITRAAKQCLPCCLSEPKVSDPESPKQRDVRCNVRGLQRLGDTGRPAASKQEFLDLDVWDAPPDARQVSGAQVACDSGCVVAEGQQLHVNDMLQSDADGGTTRLDGLTKTIMDEAGDLLCDDSSQELAAALCRLACGTQACLDGVVDADTTLDDSTDASASPSSQSADTIDDAAAQSTCSPNRVDSAPAALGGNDDASVHLPVASVVAGTPDTAEKVQASSAKARASSRGRPPAGRAPPPPRRSLSELPRGQSPGPGSSLPDWRGPSPSPSWKAERVVNWQPIRQLGRWEGSVWETVNSRMQDGFTPLPDALLNQAFMRNAEDCETPRRQRSASQTRSTKRRLSQRAALTADLLHAQLNRHGITSPSQLCWVMGHRCVKDTPSEVAAELSEDVLETLQGLLRAAVGEEGQLLKTDACDDMRLAPAEAFLQTLLAQAGPLALLRPRVDLALGIARLPAEATALESEFRMGLAAAHDILKSAAIPVLLEGVLLLGNYVNAGSKALSGAVGVTLESLTKLAHTRCLPRESPRGGSLGSRGHAHQDNALVFLVQHLQQSRPGFLEVLRRDMEGCRAARHLEPEVMEGIAGGLNTRLEQVRDCMTGCGPCSEVITEGSDTSVSPQAFKEERLRHFLDDAAPRLKVIQQLSQEFRDSTVALRRWFAESTDTSFSDMMRCLASLREALPPPHKPATLAVRQKACSSRQAGKSATARQRARSAPAEAELRTVSSISATAASLRCKSAPAKHSFSESCERQREATPSAALHPQKQAPEVAPQAKLGETRQEVVTQPLQPYIGRKLRPLPSPREVRDARRQVELSNKKAPVISLEGQHQGAAQEVIRSIQMRPCPPPVEQSKSKLAPLPSLAFEQGPSRHTSTLSVAPLSHLPAKSPLEGNHDVKAHQECNKQSAALSDLSLADHADTSAPVQTWIYSAGNPVQVALPLEFGAPEVPMQVSHIAPPNARHIGAAPVLNQVSPGASHGSAASVVKQVSLPLEFSMPQLRATPSL